MTSWIGLLHSVGLTNLTDDQVSRYHSLIDADSPDYSPDLGRQDREYFGALNGAATLTVAFVLFAGVLLLGGRRIADYRVGNVGGGPRVKNGQANKGELSREERIERELTDLRKRVSKLESLLDSALESRVPR